MDFFLVTITEFILLFERFERVAPYDCISLWSPPTAKDYFLGIEVSVGRGLIMTGSLLRGLLGRLRKV